MSPNFSLLNPAFFFILILILLGLSMLIIRGLAHQDKESQKSLNKAIADKDTLVKEVQNLKYELGRLNSELSLRNQMFEGLKGQYDELERDYEKSAQKVQEGGQDIPSAASASKPKA